MANFDLLANNERSSNSRYFYRKPTVFDNQNSAYLVYYSLSTDHAVSDTQEENIADLFRNGWSATYNIKINSQDASDPQPVNFAVNRYLPLSIPRTIISTEGYEQTLLKYEVIFNITAPNGEQWGTKAITCLIVPIIPGNTIYFPNIDFDFYPTYQINEYQSYPNVEITKLYDYNYKNNSSGTYFYGEGHTQDIILKPLVPASAFNFTKCYVGNSIDDIIKDPSINSKYAVTEIVSSVSLSGYTQEYTNSVYCCTVSSESGVYKNEPVSFLHIPQYFRPGNRELGDGNVTLNSLPIITYRDNEDINDKNNGKYISIDNQIVNEPVGFYPYFISSRTVNGLDLSFPNLPERKYKTDLEIRTYPFIEGLYGLDAPFTNTSNVSLSVRLNEQQYFKASVVKTTDDIFFKDELVSTSWKVQGESNNENDVFPDWEWNETVVASALEFPLSFYNEDEIFAQTGTWQVSKLNPTTILLSVSTTNRMFLSAYDPDPTATKVEYNDWQPTNQTRVLKALSSTIFPPPEGNLINLYAPNYYNLINNDIYVYVLINRDISKEYFDLIQSITVYGDQTSDTFTLQKNELETLYEQGYFPKSLTFNDKGVISLSASVEIKQQEDTLPYPETYINQYYFSNVFEIFKEYDTVDSFYYRGPETIENLLTFSAPRLSPNEWATEDNFNSIINKYYTVISELDANSKSYILKTNISDVIIQEPDSVITGLLSFEDPSKNNLLFTTKNSIRLIQGVNYTEPTITYKNIDDVFEFSNIINIQSTKDGKFVVLDNDVSRISVYTANLEASSFDLFTTWGKFGLKNNTEGFNEPQDFHIDKYNKLWIADTGNSCLKQFSITGRNLQILSIDYFEEYPPLSVCVDADDHLHVLTKSGTIIVLSYNGEYVFEYSLPILDPAIELTDQSKIQTNYNREMIYVTHRYGVLKFYKNGIFFSSIIDRFSVQNKVIENFTSIYQDSFRNTYVCAENIIFKISDVMQLVDNKTLNYRDLIWKESDLQIKQNEYIQGWVYLQSFHKMWDNIELFRNILYYNDQICQFYSPPVYKKEDLVIGQNEIVSNSVINRLSDQLWINLKSLIDDYFNAACQKEKEPISSKTIITYIADCNFDFRVTCYNCDIMGYVECKECDMRGYILCNESTPLPTPTPTSTPTPTPTPSPTPLSFSLQVDTQQLFQESVFNNRVNPIDQ